MDYIGRVIGDMEILEYVEYKYNHNYYKVKCNICGFVREVSISNLLRQGSKHCYRTCGNQYLEQQYMGTYWGDYQVIGILPHNTLVLECKECNNKIICIEQNLKTRLHSIKICQQKYFDNLIGKIFGDFKVISYLGKKDSTNLHYLNVQCEKCGRQRALTANTLLSQIKNHKDCIELIPKDQYSKTIIYRYQDIIQKTSNPNHQKYQYYGGRGVSNQFNSVIDFYDYIYDDFVRKSKLFGENNISIDRINNDGNYAKDNIRLATRIEQQSNTRRNKYFLAIKDDEIVLANNAMLFGRRFNLNGRTVGNHLRSNKNYAGWKFEIISKERVNEVLTNGSVTTNLLLS